MEGLPKTKSNPEKLGETVPKGLLRITTCSLSLCICQEFPFLRPRHLSVCACCRALFPAPCRNVARGHVHKCLIIFSTSAAASRGPFSPFPGPPVAGGLSGPPEERAPGFTFGFPFPSRPRSGLCSSAVLSIALQASTKPRSCFPVCWWGFWPVSKEKQIDPPRPVAVLPPPPGRGCRRGGVLSWPWEVRGDL